ncbi:MAG TPA: chemotaxis protein CheD, partial [Rhodopila sp.]|nr:chemotaxis protein CheD [Rhodopila sp.]
MPPVITRTPAGLGPHATMPHRVVKVGQGECYLTAQANEELVTVLGSCISACIRDPVLHLGGMNHFLLPECGGTNPGREPDGLRYGTAAMDHLIGRILALGGLRERLEVKVFGGA